MITGIWCSPQEALLRLRVFFSRAHSLSPPPSAFSRTAIKRWNTNCCSDSPHGGQTITPRCCFVPLLFKRQQNFLGFQRFLTLDWRRGNKRACQRQSGSCCHLLCSRLSRVPLRVNLPFTSQASVRLTLVCRGRSGVAQALLLGDVRMKMNTLYNMVQFINMQ